jgi:predicted methyltransferase
MTVARIWLTKTVRTLALAGAALAMSPAALAAPANVAAAVAATPLRTAANVERDAGRKPVQLLGFLGLQRGMRVLDPFGGNLYWAEIVAPAVGPKGSVTIWQPTQFMSPKTRTAIDAFAATHANVSSLSSPFETPEFGRGYDFALINLDYHDVYWQNEKNKIVRMEPQAWLKRLYAAMKPGATVGIVDHVAKPGSDPRASVEAMHRIDPAVVRADFKRAGFRLVAESDMLRNPADDHMVGVFDEKIRGRTDRFVMKFRKPMR